MGGGDEGGTCKGETVTLVLGPYDVPFTQYLRPHGRPVEVCIERPPDVAAATKRLLKAGFHFDIEELSNRTVSMTVEPNAPDADGEDAPIAIEVCPNGPDVPPTVDRLILSAVAKVELAKVKQ